VDVFVCVLASPAKATLAHELLGRDRKCFTVHVVLSVSKFVHFCARPAER
jgi:hypothetical protein